MEAELQTVAAQVMNAADYLDVFGKCNGNTRAQTKQVKGVYRRLARVLHPDRYTKDDSRALAEQVFARLGELKAQADYAVEQGIYGQPIALATVRTKRAAHVIVHEAARGDLCSVYAARSQFDTGEVVTACKVVRNARNNDLLQTEAKALQRLRADGTDPQWHPFIPELVDSFTTREAGKPNRAANVTPWLDGFYTLEQVMAAYPAGIDPRDMAWMWRRLLVAVAYANATRVIHGAVLPPHVMIHPEGHALVLVDWCYASLGDDEWNFPPIKAVVDRYRDWYPEEVLAKQAPSPATDIIMAARCMVAVMGGDPRTGNLPGSVPMPFRAFFNGCMSAKQSARPQEAWGLLLEFEQLLESMGAPYFPRRFHEFTMPDGI